MKNGRNYSKYSIKIKTMCGYKNRGCYCIPLTLAGRGGLEPPPADPESAVLPLDDLPNSCFLIIHQR